MASTADGNASTPQVNVAAKATTVALYYQAIPTNAMGSNSISSTGGSQPHNNFQPYLCLDFIISLFGIFPSPT
jgi:microcystin-dependent protein